MTDRTPVTTSAAPPPAGTYSQGIVAGGLLFVAGQTPRRPDGTRLDDQPFAVQARQALTNVEEIAAAAGTTLAQAVSVTCYLSNPDDRFAFDEIWADFVSQPYPARAVVQSDLPGFTIEISAVVACPSP